MLRSRHFYWLLTTLGLGAAFGVLHVPLGGGEAEIPPSAGLTIAMLQPGSIRDHGWTQAGYEGLVALRDDPSLRVLHANGLKPDASEATFRRFSREGARLVIGYGVQYFSALEQVAGEFPQTSYAVVGAYAGNNRNLGALSFRHEELAYLAGAVAALKSRRGHVGMVQGDETPAFQQVERAFTAGARRIRPGVRVSSRIVGSWTDPERARRRTRELLAAGADVVLVNVNTAGPAIREAERSAAYAIGWSSDQYAVAPRAVVTSALLNVPALLRHAADLVRRGRWEGKLYKMGLREKAVELAPFRGALTPAQIEQVRALEDELRRGQAKPRAF